MDGSHKRRVPAGMIGRKEEKRDWIGYSGSDEDGGGRYRLLDGLVGRE